MDYMTQSEMSSPGAYAHLYGTLPHDLTTLCAVVRGIYIHYRADEGYAIPPDRLVEVDTRRCDLILQRIHQLDPRPLTEARPPERRFVGCCRDASLLLCSMLRHHGIPARLRAGFARYIQTSASGFKPDHVVVEVHDGHTWKLVDAEQSAELIQINGITFDVEDIPRDQFIVGGSAWQMCRSGADDPQNYGDEPGETFWRGNWAIRSRIVYDIAALNKVEYLLWDTWGLNAYGEPSKDDLHLIDRAAALSANAHEEAHLPQIQRIYEDARLHAPRTVMCYSPVQEPREVTL